MSLKWKLGLLAVATAAVLLVLVTPMTTTISIKVDLPPTGGAHVDEGALERSGAWIGGIIEGLLVLGVLATSAWIGQRIVRRHRARG